MANGSSHGVGLDPQAFLAADVGGTYTRVALVRAAAEAHQGLQVLAYRKFACADYADLTSLLTTFVDDNAALPVRRCVIACAGHVIDDTVLNTNLAWPVSPPQLRSGLALDDLAVLNDFEALGYALDGAKDNADPLLCGLDADRDGATLVIGAGTGLGAAVRLRDPSGTRVLATEVGQMKFTPESARERAMLARFAADDYVSYEQILSGPGLVALYLGLCQLRGRPPELATPETVTSAARAGRDPIAVEAVDMFCSELGSLVGDLALAFLASGGVYLAGGVLSDIKDLLQQSHFAERFLSKGSMRQFLRRVPVRIMKDGRYGVIGAARWYLGKSVNYAVHGAVKHAVAKKLI